MNFELFRGAKPLQPIILLWRKNRLTLSSGARPLNWWPPSRSFLRPPAPLLFSFDLLTFTPQEKPDYKTQNPSERESSQRREKISEIPENRSENNGEHPRHNLVILNVQILFRKDHRTGIFRTLHRRSFSEIQVFQELFVTLREKKRSKKEREGRVTSKRNRSYFAEGGATALSSDESVTSGLSFVTESSFRPFPRSL
ncbi:MAG: hypothetical protein KDM63_00125 [Verrucomicrobiae bacterium]|nr:hypothetical protein [Verrucomicrobiae bacterium]